MPPDARNLRRSGRRSGRGGRRPGQARSENDPARDYEDVPSECVRRDVRAAGDEPRRRRTPRGEGQAMATREQIEANRKNAKKSTGPRDTDRTRFNGLKHGLRAEQVVLPGEDPAAFRAEVEAWFDDWRPRSPHPRPADRARRGRLVAAPPRHGLRVGPPRQARRRRRAAPSTPRSPHGSSGPSPASTTSRGRPCRSWSRTPPGSTACSPPGACWSRPGGGGPAAGTNPSTTTG